MAASAACGAAPTAAVLVAARIAQGAAGGILNPQISATIQQLFQGAERGKAFGYFASVVSVASAIGPLVGGALIAGFGIHAGWRAVFYVNVPIGLVLIPLAVRLLPRHVRAAGRGPAWTYGVPRCSAWGSRSSSCRSSRAAGVPGGGGCCLVPPPCLPRSCGGSGEPPIPSWT